MAGTGWQLIWDLHIWNWGFIWDFHIWDFLCTLFSRHIPFVRLLFLLYVASHTPSKTTNKCHIIINMSSLFRGLIERGERWGALLWLAQLGVSSKVMWLANARSVVYLQKSIDRSNQRMTNYTFPPKIFKSNSKVLHGGKIALVKCRLQKWLLWHRTSNQWGV